MDTKYLFRQLRNALISSVLLSTSAIADPFYGSVSAVSGVSDNGLKSEYDTLEERQDQYGINLGSDWENSLLEFHMGYGAAAQTFSKDSQEEKTFLEGSSSLLLGKDNQPANLLLEHSRITLLNSPESLNLTQNQDEKDMFSAKPTLRQSISAVDTLLVNGDYTRIKYLETDIKDSQRTGGSVVWDHRLSVLDSIQISAQQSAIDFKRVPEADYTYRSAGITYQAKLRKVAYSLTLGGNETIPELGEEHSSPSYAVDVAYESAGHKFSVDANQSLTDTSAGGNNILPENDLPTSDGTGLTPDQIERATYGVNWSTIGLCQGCTLSVGLRHTNDDYLNLDADATEQSWNTQLGYAISRVSTLSVEFAGGNHKYSEIALGGDYKILLSRLEYAYQVTKDFGVKGILEQEKRYGERSTQRYTENYLGAGIDYKF